MAASAIRTGTRVELFFQRHEIPDQSEMNKKKDNFFQIGLWTRDERAEAIWHRWKVSHAKGP